MEFFIKKDSTLPILIMEVVNDGRTDNYKKFNEDLVNASIRFSMKRESDGAQKIVMNNAFITEKLLNNSDSPEEYYIYINGHREILTKKVGLLGNLQLLQKTVI